MSHPTSGPTLLLCGGRGGRKQDDHRKVCLVHRGTDTTTEGTQTTEDELRIRDEFTEGYGVPFTEHQKKQGVSTLPRTFREQYPGHRTTRVACAFETDRTGHRDLGPHRPT